MKLIISFFPTDLVQSQVTRATLRNKGLAIKKASQELCPTDQNANVNTLYVFNIDQILFKPTEAKSLLKLQNYANFFWKMC